MTTGDALFLAVMADFKDEAARLVWAEWLEENGLPNAAAWWRGEEAATLMALLAAIREGKGAIYVPPHPRPMPLLLRERHQEDGGREIDFVALTYDPDPTPPPVSPQP